MKLLPREALVKTGPVDHADWNYRPVLGYIQRLRFRIILALLGERRYPRLLEVGYGSGVFMPELATRCDELFGIDVHPHPAEVTEALAKHGVTARLFSGSAASLAFEDQSFDALVAVSCLEFIDDFPAACREMKRVLRPGGVLVAVTPGSSPLVDFGLKVLTGKSARTDFEDRRLRVLPMLRGQFSVERQRTFPWLGGSLVRLYTGLRLCPLPVAAPAAGPLPATTP
jgi:ubiquinone/menaquinone biosynthesis C-methylase UbiE